MLAVDVEQPALAAREPQEEDASVRALAFCILEARKHHRCRPAKYSRHRKHHRPNHLLDHWKYSLCYLAVYRTTNCRNTACSTTYVVHPSSLIPALSLSCFFGYFLLLVVAWGIVCNLGIRAGVHTAYPVMLSI